MSTPSYDDRDPGESSNVRLPAPGEDATPFVLRCYVKRGRFRPLFELEPDRRPLYEEYKLYVWRTATLRDIATLLYVRNRALSSASTLHSFRLVHFDGRRGQCVAREVGTRITRLPARSLEKALDQALRGDHNDEEDAGMDDVAPSLFQSIERECRPEVPREADEEAAGMTLENLDFRDGDILDCVFVEPMAKTHPSDWSSDHRSIPDIEVRHQHVHPRTDRPPRQNGRRLV